MVTLFEKESKSLATQPSQEAEIVEKVKIPLSTFTQEFLTAREKSLLAFDKSPDHPIRVSEVLGTIAHIYEKIRNTIEYKGEHVLRRNAIERILKRLLWEHASHDTERIAQVLLRELIWARYLPNDAIPKSKTKDIARVLNRYLALIGRLTANGTAISEPVLRKWIWGVTSCEIEETLDPSNREPFVELMFNWFRLRFTWQNDELSAHEKEVQIYLAIHRALAKSDDQIMRYHLLLKEYPSWPHGTEQDIQHLTSNFYKIYQEIERHLNFTDRFILYRLIQKHVAPFEVLRQLVQEEELKARSIIQDIDKFEWKVREICQRRYAQIQKKVSRGIFRSIVYIFITKVVLALLIEIPYELYRFGGLNYIPLGINVVVPPSMMWLIGLSIKAPGDDNTQRIIDRLKTIAYVSSDSAKSPFSLLKVSRGSFLTRAFAFFYMILFLFVFGGIAYLLLKLEFTVLGIVIFFAFLSLVLLLGFRVRFTASELKVTPDKEGLFGHLFNNLTLPFLSTGVYLSKGLAKINFFTVILDFLIEAPLKTIIEVIEEWTSFIREKREEVVEVPEP